MGFGAAGFTWAISAVNRELFQGGSSWLVILLPALGGLAAGLFLHFIAKGAKPGIPDTITRIEKEGGRIPVRLGVFNTIASFFTIGSGGSAGTEGSIIQIGSAFGSGMAGVV